MRGLAPIPSEGRLLRTVRRVAEHARNAQIIAKLAPEPDNDDETKFVRPSRRTPAGDERALRGIPAIGRNVGGAIPGTRPDRMELPD